MRFVVDLIDKIIIIISSIIVDFIINDVIVDEVEFMVRILVFYIIVGFIYCLVMDSLKI